MIMMTFNDMLLVTDVCILILVERYLKPLDGYHNVCFIVHRKDQLDYDRAQPC